MIKVVRVLATAIALLLAVALQTTGFPQLDYGGATPDIMLVVVLCIAVARGPSTGMIVGFFGGLLVDMTPPADHALGRVALVYCIVGYAIGSARGEGRRSAFLPMLLVGVGALVAGVLDLGFGSLLGYVRSPLGPALATLPVSVVYDVVLTPFVFPVVAALDRRLVSYRGARL